MVEYPVAGFARKLRELREKKGLTQKELADLADLHQYAIVKLERGERQPAWPTLLALSKALDVPVGTFAEEPTGEETPRRPGRPRKEQSEESTPEESSPPKRSRGRPRKSDE